MGSVHTNGILEEFDRHWNPEIVPPSSLEDDTLIAEHLIGHHVLLNLNKRSHRNLMRVVSMK